MMTLKYRPVGATDDRSGKGPRIEASIWSDGNRGKWVVPLEGPRRYVFVKLLRGVWVEQESPPAAIRTWRP